MRLIFAEIQDEQLRAFWLVWRSERMPTLRGTNISHLGNMKIIFKHTLGGDMLVSSRVNFGNEKPIMTSQLMYNPIPDQKTNRIQS